MNSKHCAEFAEDNETLEKLHSDTGGWLRCIREGCEGWLQYIAEKLVPSRPPLTPEKPQEPEASPNAAMMMGMTPTQPFLGTTIQKKGDAMVTTTTIKKSPTTLPVTPAPEREDDSRMMTPTPEGNHELRVCCECANFYRTKWGERGPG